MRIINITLKTTSDMTVFYKNLDCDAFTYAFMREALDRSAQKTAQEAADETLKQAYKIFKYYRNDIGGRYESREFALPDRIKFFPLYMSSILSRHCFNPKIQVGNQDYNYHAMVALCQLHITKIAYVLYPKVFDISKLFEEWKEERMVAGQVNENELIALPNSIPANLVMVKHDGCYLIDNGEMMYLNVRKNVNPELIAQTFGLEDFSQLETPFPLQALDSPFSNALHNIIGRLRGIKNGAIQPVLVIAENDDNAYRLRNTFVEDVGTVISNHYWDFLSQLHEKVKEE